jgi:TonB C terminal
MARSTSGARTAVQLSCALISLVFHALLVAPALLGFGAHARRLPDQHGVESVDQRAGEPSALTVFFIDDTSESDQASNAAKQKSLTSSVVTASNLLPVNPVDSTLDAQLASRLPLIDDSSQKTPSSDETQEDATSRMLGRYVGQVTARIERAWMRPRVSGFFSCRVQIDQERNGSVKEITLKECDADIRWQRSLVNAIQSASPLPAPPDPDVFQTSLTLELSSVGFTPGGNAEGFEPAAREVALAAGNSPSADPSSRSSFDRQLQSLRELHRGQGKTENIDLRIEGTPRTTP